MMKRSDDAYETAQAFSAFAAPMMDCDDVVAMEGMLTEKEAEEACESAPAPADGDADGDEAEAAPPTGHHIPLCEGPLGRPERLGCCLAEVRRPWQRAQHIADSVIAVLD